MTKQKNVTAKTIKKILGGLKTQNQESHLVQVNKGIIEYLSQFLWRKGNQQGRQKFGLESIDFEQQIAEIIHNSQKKGVISKQNKIDIANLIRNNKGLPRSLRAKLWVLASGAESSKRSNQNYYILKEKSARSPTFVHEKL